MWSEDLTVPTDMVDFLVGFSEAHGDEDAVVLLVPEE
jgi:hypothetical protein